MKVNNDMVFNLSNYTWILDNEAAKTRIQKIYYLL